MKNLFNKEMNDNCLTTVNSKKVLRIACRVTPVILVIGVIYGIVKYIDNKLNERRMIEWSKTLNL